MTAEAIMETTLTVTCQIKLQKCQVPTLLIKKAIHSYKNIKSCIHASAMTDAKKTTVHVTLLQTINVSLGCAAKTVLNTRTDFYKQKENYKNREFITLMILNHVLARRPNAIKNIVRAMQQVENVRTCVLVISVLTATFFSISRRRITRLRHICRWSMKKELKCHKKWIFSQFNFPNYDF